MLPGIVKNQVLFVLLSSYQAMKIHERFSACTDILFNLFLKFPTRDDNLQQQNSRKLIN